MPRVEIPVNNTDTTVSKLITKSVIEGLMYDTNMSNIADIIYLQKAGVNATSQTQTPTEPLQLGVDNYIKVEYDETYEETYFDISKYQDEYLPIFRASALGVNLYPMHARTNLEISFTHIAKSNSDLTNWQNAFRRRMLTTQPMNYHDVLYNYTIPSVALAYIHQVYDLTESVAGYGYTLREFLTKHFTKDGIMVRRNLNDTKAALCVNVKQIGCLGMFTALPSVTETGREPPLSTLTFTYTLTYDRVTAVLLEYQKYIHNQVIDLKYIRRYADRKYRQNQHGGHKTISQAVNMVTENQYGIPDYPDDSNTDGWDSNIKYNKVTTMLVLPIQLNLPDLRTVLDLNLLIDFGFPAMLLEIMLKYKDFLTTLYGWFLFIELFDVCSTTELIPIHIDSNFNVIANVDLDPRCRHYLRFSLNFDLTKMDFSLLQKDPEFLLWMLQFLNANATLDLLGDGTYATTASIERAIGLIGNTYYKHQTTLNTMSTTIIPRRK